MKTKPLLLVAALFIVSSIASIAATKGISGKLDVQSVLTSDRKAVFVVSGSGELLLSKPPDSHGNGQFVTTLLDQAVIVLYRTHAEFPADDAWHKACEGFKSFTNKHVQFQIATASYTWEDGDLTLISTRALQAWIARP